MSDMNNLLRFLALFGGNSAKENLSNIDKSAGIGNGDGTIIKAEFNRAVNSKWDIIKNNGWNGEKTEKTDLIDKWWASLDIDNSNRKISGTSLTEVNALSGKELDRLNSLSEDFDWDTSRAETDYDTTTIEDNDGGVDGPDNDDNDYDKKGNYTKYIDEATNHYNKVSTLKTLLGENLYNLVTKDSTYLKSVIAVTVSANIESCVAGNAVDYQAMDKVIVEALAAKIFTRQDVASKMNTSDMKEVYDLRMKYVNEDDIDSIDEIRNIAADYLTALVANYEGDELSSILKNIFGEKSPFEAIKDMGTEEIKSKMAELMTAVEGLQKPEKITYSFGDFEKSYNIEPDKYLTIKPSLVDNNGNSPANVEYKLTYSGSESVFIEGLDFKCDKEGAYELTLTAIVDGKEVGVTTITVNVKEVFDAKRYGVNDLDLGLSDVFKGTKTSGKITSTITKDGKEANTENLNITYKSSTDGVVINGNTITVTAKEMGQLSISIDVLINGVIIDTIVKQIDVKMSKNAPVTEQLSHIEANKLYNSMYYTDGTIVNKQGATFNDLYIGDGLICLGHWNCTDAKNNRRNMVSSVSDQLSEVCGNIVNCLASLGIYDKSKLQVAARTVIGKYTKPLGDCLPADGRAANCYRFDGGTNESAEYDYKTLAKYVGQNRGSCSNQITWSCNYNGINSYAFFVPFKDLVDDIIAEYKRIAG